MNKKIWAAMFLLCLLGLLAGCSKKGKHQRRARHFAELGGKAGASLGADRSCDSGQRERHCDLRRGGPEGSEN